MSTKTIGIVELILSVVKRPAMYGVNRVEDISLIVLGYTFCESNEKPETNKILESFRKYVNKNLDSVEDVDWVRLIRFYSGGDLHSIQLFSKLFSSFLEQFSIDSPNKI